MNRGVCIPPSQVKLHVVGETLALVFVVPAMTYLAFRKDVPPVVRTIAGATALFSLVVDGYLLRKFSLYNKTPSHPE